MWMQHDTEIHQRTRLQGMTRNQEKQAQHLSMFSIECGVDSPETADALRGGIASFWEQKAVVSVCPSTWMETWKALTLIGFLAFNRFRSRLSIPWEPLPSDTWQKQMRTLAEGGTSKAPLYFYKWFPTYNIQHMIKPHTEAIKNSWTKPKDRTNRNENALKWKAKPGS